MTNLHRREHHSVLAAAERRMLVAIAERLPARTTSDHLTTLAFVSMVIAGIAFRAVARHPWAAVGVVVGLGANWFGDSLDGTLARVRRCERPRYGYYVDHVVDFAGVAALLAGMGSSGAMRPTIAAALLAAYAIAAAESFLATHATGTFRLSFAGIGPTELRILLAGAAVWVAAHPSTALLNNGGAIAAGGLALAFLVNALRNARALHAAERLAARDGSRAA